MSRNDGHPPRRLCELCGRPVPLGAGETALIPDSAAVYDDNPRKDGTRIALACGTEHLDHLIIRACDSWQDAQLWFGWLCRASRRPELRRASLIRLAEKALLTGDELAAALAWNADRPAPLRTLPGGQPICTTDRSAPVRPSSVAE